MKRPAAALCLTLLALGSPTWAASEVVTEYQVAPIVTVPAQDLVNFYARCSQGVRIGGGYQFEMRPPNSPYLTITNNGPSEPNDWRIDVQNYSDRDVRVRVGVYVICLLEDDLYG